MKNFKYLILTVLIGGLAGCADYLDVVPDGIATMDNAFSDRINAEKFLYGCYNYLPNVAAAFGYPANIGGDEIWWDIDVSGFGNRSGGRIARGEQGATNPYQNYWDGANDGKCMWIGIRDCNIMIENIVDPNRVPDLREEERLRWLAEAKFLKAYFHFFLMQLYGPIPIVRDNISVDASPEEVRIFREPVDSVVAYIVQLCDEAVEYLPPFIEETTTETGRATIAIAKSIKAKALVWAASPLFNGNNEYAGFVDKRGIQLIADERTDGEKMAKWEAAAAALKDALEACAYAGHRLYKFQRGFIAMTDTTELKFTLRGAVTQRLNLNPEIVWGDNHDPGEFQRWASPRFQSSYAGTSELSTTLKIAEQYYSKNGVPIDEDTEWRHDYTNRYVFRADTGTFHKSYISPGETTAQLNFYREPRFYAHLGFDRSIWEEETKTEAEYKIIMQRYGEPQGGAFQDCHIYTGYYMKKLFHPRSYTGYENGPNAYRYSWPLIRMADMYLLYAEALNEIKPTPDKEVWDMVDSVRLRAGLEGVVDSWFYYSQYPNRPKDKTEMRKIIKRERLIELAFEGQRFFDLRRWKDALEYLNQPIAGWYWQGNTADTYYAPITYFSTRNFKTRDYLWPLRNSTIIQNSNLVQNPGW